MTQNNSVNVKLSNLQLNELKSAINYATEVTLKLSSNVTGDSNGETNFPNKLLLTDRQVAKLRKTFANNASANIKLSKTQLSKIVQLGGFLGRLLRWLLKTGLSLLNNAIKPLAKSILMPWGLTATVSATDAVFQKKIHSSGIAALIISNEEMDYIMKIDLSKNLVYS